MAILKSKDIAKMAEKEMDEKLKELGTELIKSKVASKKGGKSSLREIKRTIAKLLTFKRANEMKNKKEEIKAKPVEAKK
jgi:ribosomal protein L29